jgi:putative transposase
MRQLADHLRDRYGVSIRRACRVIKLWKATYEYKHRRGSQAPLLQRIREIASVRVRYGYRRISVLLRREGWPVNHKRVYRLYRADGLSLRYKRPKRHKTAAHRPAREAPASVNACWSMDFMSDQLFDGRRFRVLTVVDAFTRECLAAEPDQAIKGEQVVEVLEHLRQVRGAPNTIRVDNGPEFISKALDRWAYEHRVTLDFSRPGRPTDNAYIESFNGRLREECLNTHWFMSMPDAKRKISAWKEDYNQMRPHTALAFKTPAEFAREIGNRPISVDSKPIQLPT